MNKMNDNLMVTVSGGRSSAMMARHIQTNKKYEKYNKVYVFCNTGMERPETIDFLKKIEKHWNMTINKIEGVYSSVMDEGVGFKLIDNWDDLNMDALPYEQAIMHKNKGVFNGLPNQDAPYCSENLKTIPAKKFCDSIFGVNNYKKAIGFRKEDMPKRISWAEIKKDKDRIFPLITDFENPISQFDLNKWFDKQNFKLEIHGRYGNCELCWKKSDENLMANIRYGTRFIEWQNKMEIKYNSVSFRDYRSILDLVELSKNFNAEIDFTDDDFKCVCNF